MFKLYGLVFSYPDVNFVESLVFKLQICSFVLDRSPAFNRGSGV